MLSSRADNGDVLDFHYYTYEPSMPAAIIFIVLFGLATSVHIWQMIRAKTWFLIPFIIGGCFETIGYVGRALSANENPGPYTMGPYIIQSLLLLVAPALFAASIYMQLARVVLMAEGDSALFISRRWLTKMFVTGDVVSFLIQCSGGGLLATGSAGTIKVGKVMILVGLAMQLVFFGLFVVAAGLFHLRFARNPSATGHQVPWRRHLWSLYAVSGLILVRSLVRIVEYSQGYSGYIISHEVFLYLFDGTVMFTAMVVMIWIHPGEVARILRQNKGGRLDGESGHGLAMRSREAQWS